ncbi:MAG: CZB domain-containing protein [Magnetococcales bacterium]|nr:CZB domain-containing protein [Magnetococcales bacterium]
MIDLSVARLVHLKWVLQLEATIRKGRTDMILSSHDTCELGRWLHSVGQQKYGDFPELEQLNRKHRAFHHTAESMVDLFAQSKFLEADLLLDEVKTESRDLIFLLTLIEYRLLNRTLMDDLLQHPLKTLRGLIFGG